MNIASTDFGGRIRVNHATPDRIDISESVITVSCDTGGSKGVDGGLTTNNGSCASVTIREVETDAGDDVFDMDDVYGR